MKNKLFILLLLLVVNESFAQTDTKAFKDVSFALRNGGGSLMYRFGNANKPCRISLNGNADYQKLIQTDIEKSGVKQEFTFSNNNLGLRIGKQKNYAILEDKALIYVGADLSFGTSFSKSNEYKEIIDSTKAVNSNTYFKGKKGDYFSSENQIMSIYNIGISPFVGISFKLSDRFSLGTEFTVSIFSFNYSGKSIQKFSSVKNGEYSEEIRENYNPTLRYSSSLNGIADIRAIFIIGK